MKLFMHINHIFFLKGDYVSIEQQKTGEKYAEVQLQ